MGTRTKKLIRTAPKRIWLQCGDDVYLLDEDFAGAYRPEVTWCGDSVMEAEVEYVRADLVRAVLSASDRTAPDAFHRAMRGLRKTLGMTANA